MLRQVFNLVNHKFNLRPVASINFVHNDAHSMGITEKVLEKREPDMPVAMTNPFAEPKPVCVLCKYNVTVDYKNVRLLSQFVSQFSGQLYDRHITGLCERQQKIVQHALRRARASGLMPYYFKDLKYCKDPVLFNHQRPVKPHKY